MRSLRARIDAALQARVAQIIERHKEAGAAFLASASQEAGAEVATSGLVYQELEAGDGPSILGWTNLPGTPESLLLRAEHLEATAKAESAELYRVYGLCRLRGWKCEADPVEAQRAFDKAAELQ